MAEPADFQYPRSSDRLFSSSATARGQDYYSDFQYPRSSDRLFNSWGFWMSNARSSPFSILGVRIVYSTYVDLLPSLYHLCLSVSSEFGSSIQLIRIAYSPHPKQTFSILGVRIVYSTTRGIRTPLLLDSFQYPRSSDRLFNHKLHASYIHYTSGFQYPRSSDRLFNLDELDHLLTELCVSFSILGVRIVYSTISSVIS